MRIGQRLVVVSAPTDEWPFPLELGSTRRGCRSCGRECWLHPDYVIEAALVGVTCYRCAIAEASTSVDREKITLLVVGWHGIWGRDPVSI